jgi:hypothetical protein
LSQQDQRQPVSLHPESHKIKNKKKIFLCPLKGGHLKKNKTKKGRRRREFTYLRPSEMRNG